MKRISRETRRLAAQALYQLDARGEADAEAVKRSVDASAGESGGDGAAAFELASGAFGARGTADTELTELAPEWPTGRQAAMDRAILRLAHFEMMAGVTPPKVVVNEAVELAKTFSTDRSASFVNALLDKVLKRVLGNAPESGAEPVAEATEEESA